MQKVKKISQEKQIEGLFYYYIKKIGYFSDNCSEEYWTVISCISKTLKCSPHKVKKVYWKKLKPTQEFKNFLEPFSY